MKYYPMIEVTAKKFSEVWSGQAWSDVIRCAFDGRNALKVNDQKQLQLYIDHLRENYDDYQEIAEPAEYTVVRVYNWLCLARDCLAKVKGHFNKKQLNDYYDKWFGLGDCQYGENARRRRRADIIKPILFIADSSVQQEDQPALEALAKLIDGFMRCNIADCNIDIELHDIQKYVDDNCDALTAGQSPRQAVRQAREKLLRTTNVAEVAFSDLEQLK